MADTFMLRIPPALTSPLGYVASLPDEEFERLAEGVSAFDGNGPDEFFMYLMNEVGADRTTAGGVVSLVLSFETLMHDNGWSPEEAGREISNAGNSPAGTPEEREALATRIERLVGQPAVGFAARVGAAVISNERVWQGIDFTLDLRSIFDGDDFLGGVVIASAEVAYNGPDGRARRVFFALDDDALDALADAVSDAQGRRDALRAQLSDAGIRVAPTASEERDDGTG